MNHIIRFDKGPVRDATGNLWLQVFRDNRLYGVIESLNTESQWNYKNDFDNIEMRDLGTHLGVAMLMVEERLSGDISENMVDYQPRIEFSRWYQMSSGAGRKAVFEDQLHIGYLNKDRHLGASHWSYLDLNEVTILPTLDRRVFGSEMILKRNLEVECQKEVRDVIKRIQRLPIDNDDVRVSREPVDQPYSQAINECEGLIYRFLQFLESQQSEIADLFTVEGEGFGLTGRNEIREYFYQVADRSNNVNINISNNLVFEETDDGHLSATNLVTHYESRSLRVGLTDPFWGLSRGQPPRPKRITRWSKSIARWDWTFQREHGEWLVARLDSSDPVFVLHDGTAEPDG